MGLQWLFEGSTEAPETPGLGQFAGRASAFLRYSRVRIEVAACGMELAGEDSRGFAAAARAWRMGGLCITRTRGGRRLSAIRRR